jgi:S1-C subfamily serine protease
VPTAERASGGGAAIRQVVPDSPANDAGLRDGDHRTIEVRLGEQPRRAP